MARGIQATQAASPSANARRRGRPEGGALDLSATDVLVAAERLIAVDGPGVSMADVAAASSVTKPSLYRIVGDRRALVAALSRRFADRVNAVVAAELSADDDAAARFRTIFRAYLRTVEANRNLFLFISADSMGDDRIEQALAIAGVSADPLAATLRRTGVAGADADAWSYAIVGAAQFATFRWLRDPAQSADETADQLSDLLWPGIDAAVQRRRPDEEEPHVH